MHSRVCVAFMTYHGNNEAIADALSKGFEDAGCEVSLHPIRRTGPRDLPEHDLLVISSPVRMGNVVRRTRRFVKGLPSGSRVAMVITHASERDGSRYSPDRPASELVASMRSRGVDVVTGTRFLRVLDAKGPLEEGWEDELSGLVDSLCG